MDWEAVKDIVLVAVIPLVIYLYLRYRKVTAEDSDGGEIVTWDELAETFSDPDFWDYINALKEEIDRE